MYHENRSGITILPRARFRRSPTLDEPHTERIFMSNKEQNNYLVISKVRVEKKGVFVVPKIASR